jgi:hypothetical protein
MDQNMMLMLGIVQLKHPSGKYAEMVEIKGFDVIGFFFPFIRLLTGGFFGLSALFLCSGFFFYPIWSWYLGFNYKKMYFSKLMKEGWTVMETQQKAA